jgi:hypothetical protein
MNCKFCHQPCQKSPVDESAISIERCYNHPHVVKAMYYKDQPDEMIDFMFVVLYKERKYVFTFGTYHNLEIHSSYFELSCDGKWIFDMDGSPDITPENALDKLPTLLTFS